MSAQSSLPEEVSRRLGDAIVALGGDPVYMANAVTEHLLALAPVRADGLSEDEEEFLIASGTFTRESLAEARAEIERGTLHLRIIRAFLVKLYDTWPLEDVAGFLSLNRQEVITAASEGCLWAVEIAGHLRFPAWQFSVGDPKKTLPHLPEIIEAFALANDSWKSAAALMSTPQSSLTAEGPRTPAEWLREGEDLAAVLELVCAQQQW